MGILDMIAKSVFESNVGRIRWRSNMWALIGSRWDRHRLVNAALIGTRSRHINAVGEWEENGLTLVKRLCTATCPNPPGNDFYIGDKKLVWVPASECRKCTYHRPAGRFPFPRCAFNRSDDPRAIAAKTFKDMHSIVTKAGEKANEILK